RAVNVPPAIEGDYYYVVKGDTPYSLSRRFGLTVDELLQMNQIYDGNIKIGQRLLVKKNSGSGISNSNSVPAYNPTIYTVAPGDTLYSISKRFNVSVDELMQLNYMRDNNIKVGQELIIRK